jgi:hypothetical protein
LNLVTIPRIELTAATLATGIDALIRKELKEVKAESIFWSDSMTVIRYIGNETSRYKTFVANRIETIHKRSNPSQWRYVPTKENPADQASRGLSADQTLTCQAWIKGPEFLWNSVEIPDFSVGKDSNQNIKIDPELKAMVTKIGSKASNECGSADTMNRLLGYHSSWYRLKRSVAWFLRVHSFLLNKIRHKRQQSAKSENELRTLETKDLDLAENAIFRYVQRQDFKEEIQDLNEIGRVKKRSSVVRLDPFLHDGLVKVGGRLHRADYLSFNTKHQILLPKHHVVSQLVLDHIHRKVGHCGRNYMLAELRKNYWIPSANSLIRKLLGRCTICRRVKAKVNEQKMADLPSDRIMPNEPVFSRVGIDYAGPWEVKFGRRSEKRYAVIFTCLAVRAVHVEIAHKLDTSSYICALRRFIARRGQVKKFRSDNGSNFRGAERELKIAISEWNEKQIHDAMLQRNIDWSFNAPAASHHGGVWERQIRSLRKILNSTISQQRLDDESLSTVMCEVEAIMNGRPLTLASDHPDDLDPLTPNHLLHLKTEVTLPPGLFDKNDCYSKKRWRQVQYISNLFWKRWVNEYLPTLQERSKYSS